MYFWNAGTFGLQLKIKFKRLKILLKRRSPLYSFNAIIKGYLQERSANKSLAYYCCEAGTRKLSVLEEAELAGVLRKRFTSRGLFPRAKKKGELHIFVAFALNNWESVLPKALGHFGKVTPFEWRSLGFDDLSDD